MMDLTRSFISLVPLAILFALLLNIGNDLKAQDKRELGHIAGLILARGGSKGIRLKNLAKLNNETLLARALGTMKRFNKFNSLWVSTDNEEISKEARKHGAKVHWRANFTATDKAPSIWGVKDFLENHREVDMVCLVQCTSPFLKVKHLAEAFRAFKSGRVDSVFSVVRQFKLRWKIGQDGTLEADNFDPRSRPRRQDWRGELVENGMFYFTLRNIVLYDNVLQGGRLKAVELLEEDSFEIDTPQDLAMAQLILSRKQNQHKL